MIASALNDLGYVALTAYGPPAAIALCEERPIDLVISDVGMTQMNGIKLAGNLRRIRPELKVILMSATPGVFESLGAEDWTCLAKPFSIAELADRIHQKLGDAPT